MTTVKIEIQVPSSDEKDSLHRVLSVLEMAIECQIDRNYLSEVELIEKYDDEGIKVFSMSVNRTE